MGCTTCSGNPNTWCTQCMPAEDTWVAPVDKLPDVFMGDRDHMYLLPNGDLYILSPDRTKWIKVNGQGGGVTYDDTAVINRLKALEGKTDNFISSVNVSRNGNRVKLTYTLVDGTIKEVEFEDKDTVALAYDDSALKARVKALEDKPVTPTGVNTFFAKGDISGNGNSQNVRVTKDKLVNADTIKVGDIVVDSYWDKNTFNVGMFKAASVDGNNVVLNGINDITYKQPKQSLTLADRVLSISEGNSVTLPNDKQTISRQGNKLVLSNGGGEVDLPTSNNSMPYDDTALKARVNELEKIKYKDKDTTVYPYLAEDLIYVEKKHRIGQNLYKIFTYKTPSSNKPLTEPFIENVLQFDFNLQEKNSLTGETYNRNGTDSSIAKVARQFEELYSEQTYSLSDNTSLLVKLNTVWMSSDNRFTYEIGLVLIYKEQEGDFVREYRHNFTVDEIDSREQAHISVQVGGVEKGYSKLTLSNVCVGMSNFGYRVYKQVGDGAYTKLETINE